MKREVNIFFKHFLAFIFITFSFQQSKSQNEKIDSLWDVYNNVKHDTIKIKLLINEIAYYLENRNPDSAIYYYKLAIKTGLEFIKQEKYNSKQELKRIKFFIAETYRYLGFSYYRASNYPVSENNYNLSINSYREIGDSSGVARCYNGIGIVYDMQNNYDMALQYYQKSVKAAEFANDKRTLTGCYSNIGIIYRNIKQYEKAIEYYNLALKIAEQLNNKSSIAACYGNLGVVYHELKNDTKSKEYYLTALKLSEESGNKYGISFCYMSLGNISIDAEKYDEAKEYYLKSLEIKKELGDEDGISILFGNIGDVYSRQSKFEEAIIYYNQSLEKSEKYGFLDNQHYAYENLSAIFEKTGNFKKALEYHKKYYSIGDSLFNTEKTKQIAEMEAIYQTEKKQQEIEKQNLELGKQNAEIQKQTILRNSFIASFILILLIAIVIYRNFRNKKKANQLLTQKNTEIEQQKEEISAQRDQLEVTNSKLQTSNQKLETLNSELEKLSIVASETDNSVVITNEKGEIEWVNDGFTRLFEYTKDEFIEKFGSNIKKSSKNKDIENAIKECIKERKTVVYITLNQTKSGKTIWIQTTLTPILKDEILFKLVAIDSDISKLKEAEEEIKQQKEELEAQSELLMQTNNQLELKNNQITDSIRYAKQIQDAMLPDLSPKSQAASSKLQNMEFDAFVFFKPKDIVSGDFYWFTKTSEYTFIAVADCTGHGVPGAFMSMIGNTLLNEIIAQKKIYSLSKILIKLDEGVNFAINKQNNSESSQEDGMEISICRIDSNNNEIDIASTNQSVYAFNDNEITIIEGGIYSIGGSSFSNKTFETHKIKLKENTKIYLLSDGFQDQFGGENRKKFGSTQLKELIKSANKYPFNEQKMIFESEFNLWRGTNKQIDDITVIGINL